MTAPSNLKVYTTTLNLAKAQYFLRFEKVYQRGVKGTNRKSSPEVINTYAFDMLSGEWGFSHEGFAFIGFLDDGSADFRDGNQRAKALVQACTVGATIGDITLPPDPDLSFDIMVTEGLDEGSWRIMNIGKSRNSADMLGQDGEVDALILGSAVQLCYLYENEPEGATFSREKWEKTRTTVAMRREYLEKNPGLRSALRVGARFNSFMTRSAAGAGYYLALKAGVDPVKLEEFMEKLSSGAHLDGTSLKLREMLLNARAKKRKVPREDQLALFIKALNAYLSGRDIKTLAFRTDVRARGGAESFPRIQVKP